MVQWSRCNKLSTEALVVIFFRHDVDVHTDKMPDMLFLTITLND